jgi:hypothetical protein
MCCSLMARWPGISGRRYAVALSRSADFPLLLIGEATTYATGMAEGPFAIDGRHHWRTRKQRMGSTESAGPRQGFSGGLEIRTC